ncbi:unnamed protein product [Prunus armeniaca]
MGSTSHLHMLYYPMACALTRDRARGAMFYSYMPKDGFEPQTSQDKHTWHGVGPSQISRPGAPGRGDVRQHVTSSFWMRCGCARACQHGLPCVEVMMRFG